MMKAFKVVKGKLVEVACNSEPRTSNNSDYAKCGQCDFWRGSGYKKCQDCGKHFAQPQTVN